MRYYTPRTATYLIIANMVGVGVFTSLGLQLQTVQDGFLILLMWFLGGLAALTGAMSYAELGGALPRSGGEYNFLGRIYHPSAGFVSGWISATIGFAAPIAAIAMAFGGNITEVFPVPDNMGTPIAVALVVLCTFFHTRNHGQSSRFQDGFTVLKILLIFVFAIAALAMAPNPQDINFSPVNAPLDTILTAPFAIGLVYVAFSYTGWNAATYILDEMESPQKDLPKVLIFGTIFVTVLYVLLNFVFLKVAPISEMLGKEERGAIAGIAAVSAFGPKGGAAMTVMLAILFISSVGAMTLAGPRAIQAIGEDHKLFRPLGKTNAAGLPMRAIMLQSAIAIGFILTSTFETIMTFAGAMLALNSAVAVLGVIVLRIREPNLERPYKSWAFPLAPIIFLTITGFFLYFTVFEKPKEALAGLAVIIAGFILYGFSKVYEKSNSADTE